MINDERDVKSYHGSINNIALEVLPERAKRVLDIGGGTGVNALAVKELCSSSLVGVIDISQYAVENAEKGLDFIECGNIEDGDLLERVSEKYGPFDLVLCLDVLEHLVDPWGMVERIDNMLAPGGCMVSSVPNIMHYSATLRLLTGRWDYRDSGVLDRTHLRFFIKRTVIDLVTSSGMRLETLETTRAPKHKFFATVFNCMTLTLLRSFVELQYVTRVRKE